jgi:nucleotide-binding universal stress UspA family protein
VSAWPGDARGFEIAKDGVGDLVVGFDGTEPSRDALAFAIGLARREQSRLIIAFIAAPSMFSSLAPDPGTWESAEQVADELRTRVTEAAGEFGITWRFEHRRGDVAHELESLAEETKSDAIVVGRSSSKVSRLLGSVAATLLRTARRPVIVVP